jgi:hypothetical protein
MICFWSNRQCKVSLPQKPFSVINHLLSIVIRLYPLINRYGSKNQQVKFFIVQIKKT